MKRIILLALMLGNVLAFAQVQPTSIQSAISNLVVIPGVAYTNIGNAKVVNLAGNNGAAVSCQYVGNNVAATGLIGLAFVVSVDGTNYCSTNHALLAIVQTAGTTAHWSYTNFPNTVLNNARYLKLSHVTNGNASYVGYITNLVVGQRW
jgi:hypothetical protein